jgi:hypothetical protein
VIPAVLALPMVQSVVGGVVGSVANVFSGYQPAPTAESQVPFSTALNSASSAAAAATVSTSSGIMRADQWNQMGGPALQSWAKGLTGRHVDATDAAGHAITGTVNAVVQNGSTISLNINGHPVTLDSLKQISWSATAI